MDLTQLATLRGRSWRVERLSGGLSNQVARVRTDDRREPALDLVVRHWSDHADWLRIDRHAEVASMSAAAAVGVTAPVVEFLPQGRLMATRFLTGRTLTRADFDDPEMVALVAATIRRLHHAESFPRDFDLRAVRRSYLARCEQTGVDLPPAYLTWETVVDRIEAALLEHPEAKVPCHNDLLPANLIHADDRVWMIDFEYAANNEPSFELGNLAATSQLTGDQLDAIVAAYDGGPSPVRLARARLWSTLASYTWSLWATAAAPGSRARDELVELGQAQYARATRELDDPGLEALITLVASSTPPLVPSPKTMTANPSGRRRAEAPHRPPAAGADS